MILNFIKIKKKKNVNKNKVYLIIIFSLNEIFLLNNKYISLLKLFIIITKIKILN
jgi:hypothetical protein